MSSSNLISVVIPTYNRGPVLLQTLNGLLCQNEAAAEIIVVDQTNYADGDQIAEQLMQLDAKCAITWLRLDQASIPAAMNQGLLVARSEYVLFLDDDVRFEADFIHQHRKVIEEYSAIAHVGQIIQPWQTVVKLESYTSGDGFVRDLHFPFNCDRTTEISNCMAGNLCVDRISAIAAGGFDENFEGAAYRFEAEFCRRMIRHTGRLFRYVPEPSLNHLHHQSGGTRTKENHLTSTSGNHSMGDYYFAFVEARGLERWGYIFKRLLLSIVARFYLTKPWYVPVRLLAEFRGLYRALKAHGGGPKTIHLAPQAVQRAEIN